MNCSEFRRAALIDPQRLPAAAREHIQACAGCREELCGWLRQDAALLQAARSTRPDSLAERLVLAHWLQRRRRRFAVAFAAGLATVGVGVMIRSLGVGRPPIDGTLAPFANLPKSELPASMALRVEQLRKAHDAGAGANSLGASDVRIYTARWCAICRQAKAYLSSHGVAFEESDIETEKGLQAYTDAGGGEGIPLMLVGNQRVVGFSEQAYDAALSCRISRRRADTSG